jgi:ankyrin repeat protein
MNNGWTPLYLASHSGHGKMVELLIQQGVDVCSPDTDGWTALHLASQLGMSRWQNCSFNMVQMCALL